MNCRVKGSEEPVSSCLEDALQAALRSAFEVALEIAVNEISRLMGQALRDVRDQVHETQQENITLKLRLQQLRAEQDNAQKLTADAEQSRFRSDSLGEEHTPSNACEQQGSEEADAYVVNKAEMNCDEINDSFHEIGDDGVLRSHEMPSSANDEKDTSDPENSLISDHIHLEPSDPDSSSPCYFGCEEVEVNNEKPGPEEPVLDSNSACGSDPRPDFSFDQRSNEEFGLDKIALAQSKLLEDWRPDPEQTQRETEPLDQGSSLGTSEISLPSSGCVDPFDGLYQSADKTTLTQPPQNCRDQMKTNVQSSLYVCKFCGHAFHSGSDLRNHHCQHHKTLLMRVGKDAFATRPNKQKQQLFPPGCSPYHCSVCNRDFNRLENLKTHLRIHTGERPYSCSVCGVRFRHAGALTRHFRIHTGEKPYICSECGKSFRNCGGLRFHQKSHSPAVLSMNTQQLS